MKSFSPPLHHESPRRGRRGHARPDRPRRHGALPRPALRRRHDRRRRRRRRASPRRRSSTTSSPRKGCSPPPRRSSPPTWPAHARADPAARRRRPRSPRWWSSSSRPATATSASRCSTSGSRPSRPRSTRAARPTRSSSRGVFADRLPGGAAERRRALAALHAATDVYTWKLLRRDLGLGRRATQQVMTRDGRGDRLGMDDGRRRTPHDPLPVHPLGRRRRAAARAVGRARPRRARAPRERALGPDRRARGVGRRRGLPALARGAAPALAARGGRLHPRPGGTHPAAADRAPVRAADLHAVRAACRGGDRGDRAAAPGRARVQQHAARPADRGRGGGAAGHRADPQHLLPARPRAAAVRDGLAAGARPARAGARPRRDGARRRGRGGPGSSRSTPRARSYGLAPLAHVWEQLDHARRVLVLSSRSFDDPSPLPPNVRYAGARLGDPGWVEPWEPPAGDAPLVLVSLSSGAQDQLACCGGSSTAWRRCPCARWSRRATRSTRRTSPRPATSRCVRSAPHSQVLEQAAAVVTHGGHGTVLRALAAGVPALVLPMGRDQLDNAARVVARGAGLRLKPSARPGAIAAAVRRLLDEPRHREGARRMAARLRAEAGRDEAADDLEGAPRRAGRRGLRPKLVLAPDAGGVGSPRSAGSPGSAGAGDGIGALEPAGLLAGRLADALLAHASSPGSSSPSWSASWSWTPWAPFCSWRSGQRHAAGPRAGRRRSTWLCAAARASERSPRSGPWARPRRRS